MSRVKPTNCVVFEIHLGNSVNCDLLGYWTVVEHMHFLLIMNIYICLNCCCMVSFLNIEFDCKSNNLNCGKFRTGNLFSPPPFGLFYRYGCDWFRRGTRLVGLVSWLSYDPRCVLLYSFRVGLPVGIRMRYFCCIIRWPDCVLWLYLETCFILIVALIELLIAL